MGKDDERHTLSLRLDKALAAEIDRLAKMEGRNFNNEVQELVRKGIELVESEKRFLKQVEPLQIVKTASSITASEADDSPKHRDAPDTKPINAEEGGVREMA